MNNEVSKLTSKELERVVLFRGIIFIILGFLFYFVGFALFTKEYKDEILFFVVAFKVCSFLTGTLLIFNYVENIHDTEGIAKRELCTLTVKHTDN